MGDLSTKEDESFPVLSFAILLFQEYINTWGSLDDDVFILQL